MLAGVLCQLAPTEQSIHEPTEPRVRINNVRALHEGLPKLCMSLAGGFPFIRPLALVSRDCDYSLPNSRSIFVNAYLANQ